MVDSNPNRPQKPKFKVGKWPPKQRTLASEIAATEEHPEQRTSASEIAATEDHPEQNQDAPDRQVPSIFCHERTEALDPSLLRPTPPIEQTAQILFVENVGKEYQLAVKDFMIETRDNRIKAKDKQIAELQSLNDAYVERAVKRIEELMNRISELEEAVDARDQENFELESQQLADLDTIQRQDTEIRVLFNELQAAKEELKYFHQQPLIELVLQRLRNSNRFSKDQSTKPVSRTSKPSFMKLPGEIRNIIYKYALVLPRPIDFWPIIPHDAPPGVDHHTILRKELKHLSPALLRVSRQVHVEALPILYGCNRFRFSDIGGWTILEAFLMHLGVRCRFLTNISVTYPQWAMDDFIHLSDEPDEKTIDEMEAIVDRLGKGFLDGPTGPSINPVYAHRHAGQIMAKLPSLKRFSMIVQYHQHIRPVMRRNSLFRDSEHDMLFTATDRPTQVDLKRSIVLIRREPHQKQYYGPYDVDDNVQMGRTELSLYCHEYGASIKGATYGKHRERVSYIVDNGADEEDIEFPEYVQQPGFRGALLRLYKEIKEAMDAR